MKKNSRGQALLEYLILLSVVLAIWAGVSRVLKSQDFFQKVFGNPWARLSNEIEFGVPADTRKQASPHHPADWTRHSTKLRAGA